MTMCVAVEAIDAGGAPSYAVKIGADSFEVNVLIPAAEADRLSRVRRTPWEGGALRIGTSAGAPAWWCAGGGDIDDDTTTVSILIGEDDQTWDVALQLPAEVIDDVLREIDRCRSTGG